MSFVSNFVADFKKGMAESAAEHGVAERRAADRERRQRKGGNTVKTLTDQVEEDKTLLESAASEIEKLQAEMTAERETLTAERDQAQSERDEAQAELAENKEILGALSEQAEQWQAERDQLAEVLKGAGVRKLLLRTYHSDKATKLTAAERKALDAFTAKINAAYDLIERLDKEAKEAAETAAAGEVEDPEE
jgi:chromosome segregation ATPase